MAGNNSRFKYSYKGVEIVMCKTCWRINMEKYYDIEFVTRQQVEDYIDGLIDQSIIKYNKTKENV